RPGTPGWRPTGTCASRPVTSPTPSRSPSWRPDTTRPSTPPVDLAVPPGEFFPAAARALVAGLGRAGVGRLVVVGLSSVLPTAAGGLLMDTPGYPQEYRFFYLGHAAGNEALREAEGAPDWLVLSPAGDFDHTGPSAGGYRFVTGDADSRITYPDLAVALLDEIDAPRHHRAHLGVEGTTPGT
ncbi:NAD(P)-dependent oxidoreductase, partial [Micromonospora sp. ATCC 39149]|uniref:NAD(P)-dependent oxidoreductase n=1 Tax=Micromonospora sp. (strain ATCC 39149 / NRRL 15099 / SCC 1413) TaxID=219305 RepID=UPI001E5F093A